MKSLFSLFLCLLAGTMLPAQTGNSLTVTQAQAEEIFLQKNLLLLSQRYRVDAAKANELQQKLYNNPVFSMELATWGDNRKWFDIGGNGQKSFGIDQLITLAGKRNKRISLAREQTNEAGLQLYDLLRTLKYELGQAFYTVSYAAELSRQYDEQMQVLRRMINSYDEQSAKRNVSLKDAVRLKTEYIQLSADRNAVLMEAITAQQTLQLLLDTTAIVIPLKEEWGFRDIPSAEAVLSKAKTNRSDLQLQNNLLRQEELNYQLQKAMSVPDLTVGAGYDQQGSYINNLYTLRAAVDLPFFNRNQGNIRQAKAQVKAAGVAKSYKENEIGNQVLGSLAKVAEAEKEYKLSQQSFNKDFPEVNSAVIDNFNKGNISLLEFMDFFENYNTTLRQLNQLQKQRRLAWQELEFVTGAVID